MKAARIARIDGWTVALALALWAVGLVFLSSIHLRDAAEIAVNQGPLQLLQSLTKLLGGHILGIGLGIAAMFVAALTPSSLHRRLAWVGILASMAGIALVFTSLGVEQGGARRAIKLIGPQIQPAEFAKAAAIVFIAAMLTHHFSGREGTRLRPDSRAAIITMIVVVMIACGMVAMQPDLDYALVIGPAMLVMMAVAGMSRRWTAAILGVVLLFGAVAVIKEPFRAQRLWAFTSATVLGQTPNPNDSGVLEQAQKSADAMAQGGLTGVGLWKGEMMRRVDSVENDFISAAIGEETGLVGQLLVTSLLAALALRLIWLARRAPVYGRLILTGTATWIALQSGINLAMASAALPTVGIPLPFLSLGGSSNMALGLILGLAFAARADSYRPSPHAAKPLAAQAYRPAAKKKRRAAPKPAKAARTAKPGQKKAKVRQGSRPSTAQPTTGGSRAHPANRRGNGGAHLSRPRDRTGRPR
jgi:cell division protein FtsW (lipid II flippase)